MDYGKNIEELGGVEILKKAMKEFYDRVYEHPWLGQYFKHIEQEVIESQQVDFMIGALGGPKNLYNGQLPVKAHQNMFITEELYDLREEMLITALRKVGACEELIEKWAKIDAAFKGSIVKQNISDCEKQFVTDEIMAFDKSGNKIAA